MVGNRKCPILIANFERLPNFAKAKFYGFTEVPPPFLILFGADEVSDYRIFGLCR
jgi:hypothetical protein